MRAKHHSREQIQHHRDIWVGALVLGGILVFTLLVLWLQQMSHDLRAANDARDALASQVQQLGHKPVAGPPGSRGEAGKSVTGPRGPKGAQGEPGTIGPTGPVGATGKPGKSGKDGDDGVGETGAPGTNGQAGQAGPKGDTGPVGPPGPPGADGKDGTDGRDGTNGQTCPDGYSLQTPAYDPDALVCRRDGAPQPEKKSGGLLSMGLDPQRRQY